ncbi:sel1 repeat family protein [Paracidovorax cattleyae]|nr:sel1 repeat family protein [Paracidovorax cattleyae]
MAGAAGMPARSARGLHDWPWTWLVLAGGVAVLASLLAWKSVHDRTRAAEQAARMEADARAARIAQAGQAQDTDARIDAIHSAWLRGQGATELPAVRAMAQDGNARAMVLLGTMLSEAHGIPKDRPEAVRWLAQAADGGSALAAVRLGAMYERGGDGEPRQLSAAENWYLRAARQGDAAGLYSLGTLYARGGDTVVQRPITACMLMELAARAHAASGRDDVLLPAGHSALGARAAQMRLAGALGMQDAAEAQRRADAWKPGQPLDL